MPRIYITEPNHFYTFELPVVPGAEVLIGTAAHCQLSLPGVEGLGEVHACISCQPQGYIISDLGTPYGTLANGVPLTSDYLMHGVEYRLGAACITLVPEGATAPPPQAAAPMQPLPPQAAAPVQPAPQQAAPAAKKPQLKKPALRASGAAAGTAAPASDLSARFNRTKSNNTATFNFIYVIVLIIAAVYAGVALRHWQNTGNCLPGIVADGK